jgi:hypothetical protein
MTYKIAGVHDFDGPFISIYSLKEESGAYIVLDLRSEGYHLLDAGESENVREEVKNSDRKDCWEVNRKGTLHYAAWYGDESSRMKMEKIIEDNYSVICWKER